jgi:hypothetical protein
MERLRNTRRQSSILFGRDIAKAPFAEPPEPAPIIGRNPSQWRHLLHARHPNGPLRVYRRLHRLASTPRHASACGEWRPRRAAGRRAEDERTSPVSIQ